MTCEFCDDGDGHCVYPIYGVAPHTHDITLGEPLSFIGSTRLLPREQWPANFREDPDCAGLGTYLRCEKCGDGEPIFSQQRNSERNETRWR